MLALVFVAMGALFGSVEVSVVAFADERAARASAAFVLASFAAGSMVSGIAYGAIAWTAPLRRRFVIAVTVLGLSVGLLPLATQVPVLGVMTFACGFAISPTIISAYGLAEQLIPPRVRTEGFSWLHTGLGLGLAIGSSVAGQAIDRGGSRFGLVATLAAGLSAVAVAWIGRGTLSR
jgi:MFS family permease